MESFSAFKDILADQKKCAIFSIFLERDQSSENLIFYTKAEKYKACATAEERRSEAQRLYEAHLMPNARQPINVDQPLRQAIFDHITGNTVGPELFLEVQVFIMKLIFNSSYPRFIRNSIFMYLFPLFSDNFVQADNQNIITDICTSIKNTFTENTDWGPVKSKNKAFDIVAKEKSTINTNYALMKCELTDLVESDPLTLLAWLVSPKEERKDWDRSFLSATIEQVLGKTTFVCRMNLANPSNVGTPTTVALLYSWHTFEDGSILLLAIDINHHKIDVSENVVYEKERLLAYYIQPQPSKLTCKITVFVKHKLAPNTPLPKDDMQQTARLEHVKRLSKHLKVVARGKHKGSLPTPLAKLFYFQMVAGPSLLSSTPSSSGTHSAGMTLEKSRDNDLATEDSGGKSAKPRSKSVVNTLISSGRRRGDSQDLEKERQEKLEAEKNAQSSSSLPSVSATPNTTNVQLERRVAELEKENEQLKQQIVELKKSLSRSELK